MVSFGSRKKPKSVLEGLFYLTHAETPAIGDGQRVCLLFTCRALPGARTQGARFSSPAAADRKLAIREDREDKPKLHSVFIVLQNHSRGTARTPVGRQRQLVAPCVGCVVGDSSERKVRRCNTMRLLITKALRASRGH